MPSASEAPLSPGISGRHCAEGLLDLCRLRFDLDIEKDQRIRKPDDMVQVQPRLFTTDGLLINACTLGEEHASRYGDDRHCTVNLSDDKKQLLDVQTSGFA